MWILITSAYTHITSKSFQSQFFYLQDVGLPSQVANFTKVSHKHDGCTVNGNGTMLLHQIDQHCMVFVKCIIVFCLCPEFLHTKIDWCLRHSITCHYVSPVCKLLLLNVMWFLLNQRVTTLPGTKKGGFGRFLSKVSMKDSPSISKNCVDIQVKEMNNHTAINMCNINLSAAGEGIARFKNMHLWLAINCHLLLLILVFLHACMLDFLNKKKSNDKTSGRLGKVDGPSNQTFPPKL